MSLTDHKRRWTSDELELLNTKLSNNEISILIGRSRSAIAIKKYEIKNRHKIKNKAEPVKKIVDEVASPDLLANDKVIHSDDIYFDFYEKVPLGARIYYKNSRSFYDVNSPALPILVGEIIAKYPFFCKIRNIKTGERKCIQWSDVAIYNMELLSKEKADE